MFYGLNVCFQLSKYIVCRLRGRIFKMALYHGGENDVEFVPSCSTSRDPSPTREDADLEGVLMGYPNISPALFTNLVAFKRICLARSKRLVEGTQTPQYLAFTSVSLLRLNVSASLLATGSARCGRRGRRSKEADVSYTPLSRPLEDDAWPSLVIEAGVSESLAMLRTDAAFWITNSDGRTRIVIVLSVNRRDRQILVERWEEDPRIRPNRSTANYSRIPRLIQSLTLNAGVTYVGLSFEIPAQKVFDNLPENIPRGEFLFTPDSLNEFNTIVWARAPQRQQHQQWACLYLVGVHTFSCTYLPTAFSVWGKLLQMVYVCNIRVVFAFCAADGSNSETMGSQTKHTRKNFYDGSLVKHFWWHKNNAGTSLWFQIASHYAWIISLIICQNYLHIASFSHSIWFC